MRPRRLKLIKPQLQWKFNFSFLCLAAGCIFVQTVALTLSLNRLALRLPHDGPVLLGQLGEALLFNLFILLALVVPLSVAVGTLLTFRIAGPLYRFEKFLNQVLRGERPADCRIRRGDELQEFCQLLNQVTAPLRRTEADEAQQAPPESDDVEALGAVAPLPAEAAEAAEPAEPSQSA